MLNIRGVQTKVPTRSLRKPGYEKRYRYKDLAVVIVFQKNVFERWYFRVYRNFTDSNTSQNLYFKKKK